MTASLCATLVTPIIFGSASLELSGLRYYPETLSETTIEELLVSGGLLSDLSRGITLLTPEVSAVFDCPIHLLEPLW